MHDEPHFFFGDSCREVACNATVRLEKCIHPIKANRPFCTGFVDHLVQLRDFYGWHGSQLDATGAADGVGVLLGVLGAVHA